MTSPPSRDDDELDRLLAQARWPRPEDRQIERLVDHWRRLRGRRRRGLALAGLAMAASVVLIAAIATWRTRQIPEPAVALQENRDVARPAELPHPARKDPATIVPRDPNLYEQVLLIRAFPRRGSKGIEELVAALAKDPRADVDEQLASFRGDIARVERQLWQVARTGRDAERLGAARLLARVGTSRSVPVLMELARQPATRELAVLGLARLAGDRELAQLAAIEPDAALRRQLLAMLLARGTSEAVARYLNFISVPGSRAEALDVLAGAEHPPADVLLAYLESPQGSTRVAAALALSRISDPAVVERLCDFVWSIGRQEALVALLLNHTGQAARCLNQARSNVYLVASVRAAERQLASLQIPRGGLP